jgi:hypothetical protein
LTKRGSPYILAVLRFVVVVPLVVGLAGCGRVGFDPLPGEPSADAGFSQEGGIDGPVVPPPTEGGPDASSDGPVGKPPILITRDVVLDGGASIDYGTDGPGCRIVGNGNTIRAVPGWTGHVRIVGCLVEGLGSISQPAIAIEASGSSYVTIEGSTFESSGAIEIVNHGASTATFQNNTISESSVVALDPSADNSTPAFSASGEGTATKIFRGNRVYRSSVSFKAPNWLIGGDADADANLVIGLRAALVIGASDVIVRGNYVHNFRSAGSQYEFAMTVLPGSENLLTEHNVLRRGTWVVRGLTGEFRYNAVLDTSSDSWIRDPYDGTRIHHSVFAMCAAPSVDIGAGIDAAGVTAGGIEVFSNSFDGGGTMMRMKGPLLAVGPGAGVASFRNNIVFHFPFAQGQERAALRGAPGEALDPSPARLGYADYNLFFNPDSAGARNYALAVPDLTLRVDPGFAANDALPNGPLNEQVDPALAGSTEGCFPWSDEDIKLGNVTVSEMLASYRAVYTPSAGSPALNSGDPADGAGTSIGAVGDSTHDSDRFGRRP